MKKIIATTLAFLFSMALVSCTTTVPENNEPTPAQLLEMNDNYVPWWLQ